jgi:hypothetical protein
MAINSLSTGWRPGVCTSSTRPTAPYEGQVIYETDTDKSLVWNGSAWLYLSTPQTTEIGGAWVSYTPTLTQSGAVTKTVTYAKFTQINKLCICNVRLEVTGAGTANNAITITLPLTCSSSANVRIGTALFYDGSTTISYNGAVQLLSTTTAAILPDVTNNFAGITPNVALASGDNISFCLSYEVA